MIRRSRAITLTTAVLMLAAAASASARVVIDQSIDGVRLGATERAVRAHLGKPAYTTRCPVITVCVPVPGASPGTASFVYGRALDAMLQIEFIHDRVAFMADSSRTQRTASGIGPGVSLQLVRRRSPHFSVHRYLIGQQPSGDYLTPPPRHTGDDFTMVGAAHGRVDSILVGRWNAGPKFLCDFALCS